MLILPCLSSFVGNNPRKHRYHVRLTQPEVLYVRRTTNLFIYAPLVLSKCNAGKQS